MKKVFISGCSSGIGKSLAYTYSKKGYIVGLGSRNMVALNLVKKECEEIGGCVFIYRLDVRDHKNCSLVASRFQLDAGGMGFGGNTSMDEDPWKMRVGDNHEDLTWLIK